MIELASIAVTNSTRVTPRAIRRLQHPVISTFGIVSDFDIRISSFLPYL
jgi:hypothetical protein